MIFLLQLYNSYTIDDVPMQLYNSYTVDDVPITAV